MTTRSLTAVRINGEYKIAQFGNYDGYPTGQGLYALKFLTKEMKKEKFIKKLSQLRFANEDEEDAVYQKHFEFDGANILKHIQNGNDKVVVNNIEFAQDTILCQWGYLIDFDTNTFEIYSMAHESNKYKDKEKKAEFECLNLIKKYDLNNLPTEDEFIDTFDLF